MGYTNLYLFEKRAIVADGQLVRLWRSRYKPGSGAGRGSFSAVTEGNTFGHLRVGFDDSVGHAVGQAQTLSARMNGAPVIVVRQLSSTFWH